MVFIRFKSQGFSVTLSSPQEDSSGQKYIKRCIEILPLGDVPAPLLEIFSFYSGLRKDWFSSGSEILDEETLGNDREPHPDVTAGVSLPNEAHGSPDALGPDRHVEAGGSATYLDRDFYHLGSPLLSFHYNL
jgi:hypothetical protein